MSSIDRLRSATSDEIPPKRQRNGKESLPYSSSRCLFQDDDSFPNSSARTSVVNTRALNRIITQITTILEDPNYTPFDALALIENTEISNALFSRVLRHLAIKKDDYTFNCDEDTALQVLKFGVLHDLDLAREILSHFRQRGFRTDTTTPLFFDVDVEANPHLYACRINGNEPQDPNQIAYSLTRVILKDPVITQLSVHGLNLSEVDPAPFFHAVEVNTLLQRLSLVNCSLHPDSSPLLTKTLISNTTLTQLDISQTCCHKIANAIGSALCSNSTLKVLRLDNNEFSKGSIQVLSDSLKVNTTLTELSLNNSGLSLRDATYLIESLPRVSLKTLNIANNGIDTIHMPWLELKLAQNWTLIEFHLEKLSVNAYGLLVRNCHIEAMKSLTLNDAIDP